MKGKKHSSAFWLSPLQSLSCRALTHSVFFPLSSLSTSFSSASLSILNISFSSLTGKSLTLPQQRVSAQTHMHTRETCYLATQGWDRCRPIREASERAMNGEREPIDGRVPLHIYLKQWGFNHFLTFGSLCDQTVLFHQFTGLYMLTHVISKTFAHS